MMLTRKVDGEEETRKEPDLKPALRELGTTKCPVCETRVTVFITKTNRPFINCSFCSARIFYNGRESMKRLRKKTELAESPDQ
jgi:DNA-directed RNA polymerase subunit RPC12/RpoP